MNKPSHWLSSSHKLFANWKKSPNSVSTWLTIITSNNSVKQVTSNDKSEKLRRNIKALFTVLLQSPLQTHNNNKKMD